MPNLDLQPAEVVFQLHGNSRKAGQNEWWGDAKTTHHTYASDDDVVAVQCAEDWGGSSCLPEVGWTAIFPSPSPFPWCFVLDSCSTQTSTMLSVVRSSLITLLFCALIGLCPLVQAQTAPGCSSSFTGGTFTLTPQNVSLASTASGSKRRLLQASPGSYGGPTGTGCSGTPVFTLSDGVLVRDLI